MLISPTHSWGGAVQGQELGSVIFVDPFQLRMFFDSNTIPQAPQGQLRALSQLDPTALTLLHVNWISTGNRCTTFEKAEPVL